MPRKLGQQKQRQGKQQLNPWDVPPIPPLAEHDTDETKLYAAVGHALSIWENVVEGHLAGLFTVIIGSGQGHPAALRAYGAVQTFRGRTDMLVAAAEIYFKEHPDAALVKRFDDALTLAANFAARRNDIAHGCVAATVGRSSKDNRWLLCPPMHSTSKRSAEGLNAYGYSSSIIDRFTKHFVNVGVTLNQLLVLIMARH